MDGEWPAYFFADWVPGIDRYGSFFELMRAKREMHAHPPDPAEVTRPGPSAWRVLLDVLRGPHT